MRPPRENREHVLEPGDEERPWRTYAALWRDHGVTRGALDELVLAGRVPWVTGPVLRDFLTARGLPAPEDTTHYDVQALLADAAAAALRGEDAPDIRTRAALTQRRLPCGRCGAEYVDGRPCSSCGHSPKEAAWSPGVFR